MITSLDDKSFGHACRCDVVVGERVVASRARHVGRLKRGPAGCTVHEEYGLQRRLLLPSSPAVSVAPRALLGDNCSATRSFHAGDYCRARGVIHLQWRGPSTARRCCLAWLQALQQCHYRVGATAGQQVGDRSLPREEEVDGQRNGWTASKPRADWPRSRGH